MADCQFSIPSRRNIKDNAYKMKSPPYEKYHSTPIKPVVLQNSRSEPTNRQKTTSPSRDKVKRNLSATITSCDTSETCSPIRESRSPVRQYRSPVREYVSPVRNGASPILHKASSTPTQQVRQTEMEATTLQKQRRELELLIAELRDRDRELNEMTSAHQRQLQAWEQDRQKMVGLQQTCAALEDSLLQKNDEYRQLTAKLHVLECSEQNKKTALEHTQDQLVQLTEQNSQSSLHLEQIRDENTSLNSSMASLTSNIGELEAREGELMEMLQRKDRDLGDATDHIADLCSKLKRFTAQYRECKALAQTSRQQLVECRRKLTAADHSWQLCKKEAEKHEQNYQEEHLQVGKLKQELSAMKTEVMLCNEREKRKDQLLALQKSKQERTDAELNNLRQLYERQQKDLVMLHHNLENTKEMLAAKKKLPASTSKILDTVPPTTTTTTSTTVRNEPEQSKTPPSSASSGNTPRTPPISTPRTPPVSTPFGITPRSPAISTPSGIQNRAPSNSTPPSVQSRTPPSTNSASHSTSSFSSTNEAPSTSVRLTNKPATSAADPKTAVPSRLPVTNERRNSESSSVSSPVMRRTSDASRDTAADEDVERILMELTSSSSSSSSSTKIEQDTATLTKKRVESPVSKLHKLLNESCELVHELENSISVNSSENIKIEDGTKEYNREQTTAMKEQQ